MLNFLDIAIAFRWHWRSEGIRVVMPPFSSSRLLSSILVLSSIVSAAYNTSTLCRNIPGDDAWPALEDWKTLNTSVSGRLIKTTPAGYVCHNPTYNAEACKGLNSTWIFPSAQ
jgi:hypothetical protein